MKLNLFAVTGLALLLGAPAFAHHSFSMFDRDKTVTATGLVKEYGVDQSACLDSHHGA